MAEPRGARQAAKRSPAEPGRPFARALKKLGLAALKLGALSALALLALFFALVVFLPLPEPRVPQATQVYDKNGELVTSLFVQNRVIVGQEDQSPALRKAAVAVEDKRFYSHWGLDLQAILRALWRNLKAGGVVEGGSTITSQLARELFLTQEVTLTRKFMEAVYTVKLEMRYSKDEILTMYLNQIYMGHGNYGCEVASRAYFGKPAKDLTLAEAAFLAGIIRGPEYYSPYNDLEAGLKRQDLVLKLMVEQGMIDEAQRDEAKNQKLEFPGLPERSSPYFVNYVIQEIRQKHPEIASQIYRGGYQIYTTLDLKIQKAAEEAFAKYMPAGVKDASGITQPQGALVAIEPETGYIRAMVGGRSWSETELNRATQARRQPGSAFKIFLYAAAIDEGHPLTETVTCEPVSYPGAKPGEQYTPVDFGSRPYHYAPLNIRQAIAISDNVIATRWAQEVGPDKIAEYARKLGVESPLQHNIPLALGASEVTPLEMAVAAATLSAGGIRPEPIAILKLVDARGAIIEENRPVLTNALSAETSYVLTSALRSVIGPWGTASGLQSILGGRPAAGKTGTTDDQLEAWFVGYTPELACSVYVGWDNREQSLPGTGGSIAGPIWAHFMAEALRGQPHRDWPAPDGVVWAEVCDESGLLASWWCTNTHYEVFLERALPKRERFPHFPGDLFGSSTSSPGAQGNPVPIIAAAETVPPDKVLKRPSHITVEPQIPFLPPVDFDELLRRLFPDGLPIP